MGLKQSNEKYTYCRHILRILLYRHCFAPCTNHRKKKPLPKQFHNCSSPKEAPKLRSNWSLMLRLPMPTKPLALPPSTDAHRTLDSPSVHRCSPCPWLSRRSSWREAPERAHCTDSTYNLFIEPLHRFFIRNCIPPPTVCTIPLPLPSGGTSPGGRGKGLCGNLKQNDKPKFNAPTKSLAQAKAPLCKGSCQRS